MSLLAALLGLAATGAPEVPHAFQPSRHGRHRKTTRRQFHLRVLRRRAANKRARAERARQRRAA